MLIYVFYGCSFDCKAQKLRSAHSLQNVMGPRHPKHNLEKHWGAMLQFKCAACALKLSLWMENKRTPTLEEVDNQRLLVVWVSTLLGATRPTICEGRTFCRRFYNGWDWRSSYSVLCVCYALFQLFAGGLRFCQLLTFALNFIAFWSTLKYAYVHNQSKPITPSHAIFGLSWELFTLQILLILKTQIYEQDIIIYIYIYIITILLIRQK